MITRTCVPALVGSMSFNTVSEASFSILKLNKSEPKITPAVFEGLAVILILANLLFTSGTKLFALISPTTTVAMSELVGLCVFTVISDK